jgi:hypothetical protein
MGGGNKWIVGGANDWRKMSVSPNSNGYLQCRLVLNGKLTTVKSHKLVAELFIGPCPPGSECCHNDGDRQNSHLCNIRYDTPPSNQRDRLKHGTHHRGESSPRSVLNWDLANQIREDYGTGKYTHRQLEKKYGVSFVTIGKIVRYEMWVPIDSTNI